MRSVRVVIDSHFAERGRMGRLLGAVAQNPRNIGLGINEDTAIVVSGDERFEVIGSGAVYVVDGIDPCEAIWQATRACPDPNR
jgi:cyanophycinase